MDGHRKHRRTSSCDERQPPYFAQQACDAQPDGNAQPPLDLSSHSICEPLDSSRLWQDHIEQRQQLDRSVYLGLDSETTSRYWLVNMDAAADQGRAMCYFGQHCYDSLHTRSESQILFNDAALGRQEIRSARQNLQSPLRPIGQDVGKALKPCQFTAATCICISIVCLKILQLHPRNYNYVCMYAYMHVFMYVSIGACM